MIAHNETGKEMADAIVDTAYKQMSRHHDLDFTNRQQQHPSLPTLNPLQRASKSQHIFSPKLKQRFEGVDKEQEEEDLGPSVAQYRKGKSPVKDTCIEINMQRVFVAVKSLIFKGHLLQNSAIHSKPGVKPTEMLV